MTPETALYYFIGFCLGLTEEEVEGLEDIELEWVDGPSE